MNKLDFCDLAGHLAVHTRSGVDFGVACDLIIADKNTMFLLSRIAAGADTGFR